METGICDELYPSWSMWEQFITDMQGRALQLDALRSSHPIQVLLGRSGGGGGGGGHACVRIPSPRLFPRACPWLGLVLVLG